MREISWVNLDLTTHCDQRCPDCCCGIGINRGLQHHPWTYFERLAPFIYGIDRVHLTGGEPTMHPLFAEFVPRFKALFGCRVLSLQTDGARVPQHIEVIRAHIDEVHLTDYQTRRSDLAFYFLQARAAVQLLTFEAGPLGAKFVPRARRGSGEPCERGLGGQVAYADGKFFGCCVAPGVDGAQGIEPSPNWRAEVAAAPLPCSDCWFSP